jgi:hypothetical protein
MRQARRMLVLLEAYAEKVKLDYSKQIPIFSMIGEQPSDGGKAE